MREPTRQVQDLNCPGERAPAHATKPVAPARRRGGVAADGRSLGRGTPFIKWAGGKRSLLPLLVPIVPKNFGTYHEPFLGGGALFFALRPARATLGEANSRLVRAYRGVRDHVDTVVESLRGSAHTRELFERLRDWDVDGADDASVACWLIYLNRTCFNGLYRVNRQGRFNVPFGGYTNPRICDEPTLRACSGALANAQIRHEDFAAVLGRAQRGDFVYFDPPYLPISTTSSFTSYTADGFGLRDHVRLRDVALELKEQGVHVLLSNSAAPAVLDLYKRGFKVRRVSAPRAVAAKGSSRGRVEELIIT